MKTSTFDIFILSPDSKVTYINKVKNDFWDNWKLYKDCNEEEKLQINLASYPNDCILFDRDLKEYTDEQIDSDYKKFTIMLRKRKIDYWYAYRSPKGYHVLAPFKDLDKYDEDLRKELRKYYINLFLSDPAKISDRGVVSLPDRPHFKNEVIYKIHEYNEGINEFPESIIEVCKKNIEENKRVLKKTLEDKDFSEYFEKDQFFIYLKTHIIPDGTNRDTIIFPNIAIAAVRSGKSKQEIDEILKPIIKNNFPNKHYNEFEGWYKKALNNEINDYNPVQINNWMKEYSELKIDIYDLKGDSSKDSLGIIDIKSEEFKVYWDEELDNLQDSQTEWLVDKWIPKGDICFMAGKASSFKTTICLHFGYCIANDKLVFNQYKVIPSKVLYLNEENSNAVILNIIKRVKKGLDVENGNGKIGFSLLNNFKFDSISDINKLIKFIIENKIEVIFFDSFRRFYSGEENDATLTNRLFNILKYIRSKTNTTMVLIHHSKKQNNTGTLDIRDSLRGSSDIVNAADSIIGITRKHGHDAFKIQHIKNRSSSEMKDKLIIIENNGDEKCAGAYMYEIEDQGDKESVLSVPEKAAEQIINYLDANNIRTFKFIDIASNFKDITPHNIKRSLSMLKDEGTISTSGGSKNLTYFYNKINFKEKDSKLNI